jgi:two-component system NarL family sensor kinase
MTDPTSPNSPDANARNTSGSASELANRNRELEVLNKVANGLNESVDLSESLTTTLSLVADLLGLRTGWVWLLHEDTAEPYLAAAQDLPPGLANHPQRLEGWCYCLETFRDGDLTGAANVNVVTCSRLRWLGEGTEGLRYHASIPLYARGRKLGVLNVASAEWRSLSPDDLRILHTIGDMLGLAVERARLYAHRAETGATEERNRVAREIHDTLAQGLAGIALRLDAADALLETDAERARIRALVIDALSLTRASLEETRRTMLDLRAAPLEGRTLAEALKDLVATLETSAGPRFDLVLTGATQPLPPRVEVGLYRIAQEAIGNAVRHASATKIVVILVATPERVKLNIIDDGTGFDADEVQASRFGLVGMRERARLLGGSLRVRSAVGKGTRMEVLVTLGKSEAR